MSAPIYIFAGGGTGGHLFPALAVAEELSRLQPDCRVVFACSDRDIDRRILSATPYAFVVQPIHSMPRNLRGWRDFLLAYASGRRLGRSLVKDLRPAAVFGLGAFAALPVTEAAARMGIRTALMSIDATPGLANRRLARKVDVIFTQFARTAAAFGRHADKAEAVGCPVRTGLITGDVDEARKVFDLQPDRKTLLVMAGSLGAASINQAISAISADLDELADDWQILHITGPGKLEQVAQRTTAVPAVNRTTGVSPVNRTTGVSPVNHTTGVSPVNEQNMDGTAMLRTTAVPAVNSRAERPCYGAIHRSVMEFCERMDLAYAVADLVLCRAGAATIGELAAVAAPAVLMPYPYHRDRQQERNAAEMVSAGAAALVSDSVDPVRNAEALRTTLLEIMRKPKQLEAMRKSARGLSRPDAAKRIAQWLRDI